MKIDDLKEQIRIAESNGDSEKAQQLKEKLNKMSING